MKQTCNSYGMINHLIYLISYMTTNIVWCTVYLAFDHVPVIAKVHSPKLWLCPFDLGYRRCFQESVSHQDHFVWGWWPGTSIWACGSALPGNIQHPHIADPRTTTPAYRLWGRLEYRRHTYHDILMWYIMYKDIVVTKHKIYWYLCCLQSNMA